MRAVTTLLLLLAAAGAAPAREATLDATPRRPAWEMDITPALRRLPGAAFARALPFAEAISRAADAERRVPEGEAVVWEGGFVVPAQAGRAPLVLEVDESRVLTAALLDGRPLAWSRLLQAAPWQGGEAVAFLPALAPGARARLRLDARCLPQLYPNAFGRLRLRPAELRETVRLERTPRPGAVEAVNLGAKPLKLTITVRHEDYFGVPLGSAERTLTLPAHGRAAVEAAPCAAPSLYKTIWQGRAGAEATFPYWGYPGEVRYHHERPHVLVLKGDWQFRPVVTGKEFVPPSGDEGWKSVQLPYLQPRGEQTSHRAWFRTRFSLPPAWAGRRVQLFVDSVRYAAEVFVDGRKVAARPNWQLPGKVDLTDALQPGTGEHELLLGITDYVAALAPGIAEPGGGAIQAPMRGLVAAVGHLDFGDHLGIDSVPELLAEPAVRTDWACVRTFVTGRRRLEATLELRNDGPAAQAATLTATVLDAGRPVLAVARQGVTLAPRATRTVTLKQAWPAPILWTPEDPHLYELRLELCDQAGRVLDTRRERFGLREIGIRGRFFTLNGEKFHLYGSGHITLWNETWPAMPLPQRIVRHLFKGAPAFMCGANVRMVGDELGVFVKDENLGHNAHAGERYAYQLPQTFENVFSEMAAAFRAHPNHPSVFLWDFGNELSFTGPGEPAKMGAAMNHLRRLDPTRLVTIGGASVFPEGVEVLDVHGSVPAYDREPYFFTHPEERPSYERRVGFFSQPAQGEDPARWRVASRSWCLARDGLYHTGGRPLLFSESLYAHPDLFARYSGQVAFHPVPVDPRSGWPWQVALESLNWAVGRRFMLQSARQADLAGFLCHVDRAYTRAFSPIAVFPFDRRTRFAEGAPAAMTFTVHNDRMRAETITIRWRVQDGSKLVAQQTRTVSVAAAGTQQVPVSFTLPAPGRDQEYDLLLDAWTANGDGLYRDWLRLTTFAPARLALPAGVALDLLDPAGSITPTLKASGVAFRPVTSPAEWRGGAGRPLLVGSDGLAGASPAALAALREQVAAGGLVILLDHASLPAFLSFPLSQVSDRSAACAPAGASDALLVGLARSDFQFWQTRDRDFAVYRNPLELPAKGSFRAHLFTHGGSVVFDQTPLLEVAEGKGRVLFCQLNLGAAMAREPAAQRVLANLLAWTGRPSPSAAAATALVATDRAFVREMRGRIGLDADVFDGAPAPGGTEAFAAGRYRLIVLAGRDAGARAFLAPHREALRAALRGGARLVVIGLNEAGAAWLSELAGSTLRVEPFALDRAYLASHDPLTQGLTHSDFFWGSVEPPVDLTRPQPPAAQHVGHLRLSGEGVRPLTQPAFLASVPIGKGEIVVSCARSLEYPMVRSLRILGTVLTNAGARLNPAGFETASGEPAWDFQSLDLRAHANRGFVDDPGQAVRGWSAQGPDYDLREFPLGRQTFKGVPFEVIDPKANGGRGVVALSGTKATDALPAKVEGIRVGRKAERLYFLHSAAWGAPGFQYKVWFEDRKTWIPGDADPFVVVSVKPDQHISDWYMAGEIEKGDAFLPAAQVAWTGYCANSRLGNRKVGVYLMAWDNPRPEKVIDAIDVLSPGTEGAGQPFVLGITAATRRTAAPVDLAKLLPKVRPADVLAHHQTGSYGLVVLKSGCVPLVHDAGGNALFTRVGHWYLQGMVKDQATEKTSFTHVGWQDDQAPAITRRLDAAGNTLFEIRTARSPYLTWSETITCRPRSIRVQYAFEVTRDFPEGKNTNVLLGLNAAPGARKGPITHEINTPTALIPFAGGTANAQWDPRMRWYASPGYWVGQDGISFALFTPETKVAGGKDTLWFEVELP